MHGFKSFANKTEMIFGENYNCVLGPNGSGKSNVFDALCFVLGKSSSKSLRAEKSSNLIYNGGKSKEASKTGEVSIFFDNTKREFPQKSDELKITRIVKEGGQSVYKIDNKTVTRQQVVDLLSMAKINPDGYNIILQGDIIRFIEMSPVERRKTIEEIGGISLYEEKRQKALSEIETVDVKLKELEIIMTERGSFLKELKKERDQAMKFKDLDDKLKQNKATIVYRNIEDKKAALTKVQKEIETQKKEIEKIQTEIDKLKEEIKTKREEQEKITKEIEQKGDKEQVTIQKEIENLKIESAKDQTRVKNIISEIEKIEQRKNALNENLTELQEKIKQLQEDRKNLQTKLSENIKESKNIESKIEEFKKKNKMEDASNIEKDVEQLDKIADEKQAEITILRTKEQELIREEDKLNFMVQSVDQKMEKVLSVSEENRSEIEKLKQKKTEFKKATLELNQRLNEDSSISSQLGNAKNNLNKRAEELSKLQAKNASITERMVGGEAIQRILEQKGKIQGIHGTLFELGQVKSEYSLAMEVAAGNRIKSVVVEDDKVASECIKYLKKNQFGTVTFLPLNKIKPAKTPDNLGEILKTPGVIGLSTTLMTYDPKFKNAFSFALGSAIIVKDIEVSRKIGIGTCKMVTLDGDVSETSGAMQGGFRKKTSDAGFKGKEIGEQIESLEKETSDLSNIISRLETKKSENEESIQRLRSFKAELEGDIIKTEKSLHLEEGDLDTDKKLKKELEQKLKTTRDEVYKIQDQVAKTLKDMTDAKIKKQQLRAQISELKNPRLLAELNAFEQKKQQLKDDNVRINAELKSIITQLDTTLLPQLENTQKIMKQHEKEKTDFQNENKGLEAKIKSELKIIEEKEKKQKQFYEQFKGLFAKREKNSNEINKLEANTIIRQDTIRKAEQKNNLISLEQARVSTELLAYDEEFKQFQGVEVFKEKSVEQIKKEIGQFERLVQDIGAVNLKSLEIYDKAESEFKELLGKQKTLAKEREDVLIMMNEIETKKKELFLNIFGILNKNFATIFSQLSTKGEAMLEIEDEKDPMNSGVLLKVRISGKKFLDIRSLSGGEKTMTALAFIFAIQENEPASFYIFDEVDAALDKRNSEKLAQLVKAYAARAQYIIVSHNDGMISQADILYGVSMNEHGQSKVVSLKV